MPAPMIMYFAPVGSDMLPASMEAAGPVKAWGLTLIPILAHISYRFQTNWLPLEERYAEFEQKRSDHIRPISSSAFGCEPRLGLGRYPIATSDSGGSLRAWREAARGAKVRDRVPRLTRNHPNRTGAARERASGHAAARLRHVRELSGAQRQRQLR